MPPTRPDRQRQAPPAPPPAATKAQPPRPPNAWILYRSDKLRELAQSQPPGPRKPQAEISKIISQMWSSEGPETKGMYEARAEEKKAEHAALYPDYKFAPMKKEDKALLRKAQRQEKEDIKAAERTRKKRKGKGRADDDDDEDRPFVALPYPLRPSQSWYPPSTYGPQQPQYPQHPEPRVDGFAAAGWSAPVDPDDAPFRADAYQQDDDEWAGEEGEWNNEEAFAGRSRRGAVWNEDISGQEEHQDDPVSQWTSIPNSPPPSESLTITLPATLEPSEEPYTFNLDFDVPMAAFAGDPDANVALSLNHMSLEQPSSSSQGLLDVPGLNDLLEAPLPDIAVSFAAQDGFDTLSSDNEEWWATLVGAAFVTDRYEEAGPSTAGPSEPPVVAQLGLESSAPRGPRPTPLHTNSLPTFSHGLPSPDGEAAYSVPGSYPDESYQSPAESYQYPSYPSGSYQQEYAPSPFAQIASSRPAGLRARSGSYQQPQRQPAPQPAPQQQYYQPQPAPQHQPAPQPQPAPQQQQRPAQPHRKSMSGRRPTFPNGANAFPSPSGAAQFPSPSGVAQFPSPSGAMPNQFPTPSGAMPHQFPTPSGAVPHQFPTPSGAMPHQFPTPSGGMPHRFPAPRPAPPPPFFKPKEPKTEEKDPEAFDFSGWGNQYAAQPPTPAEDAVRRGVGVSH